MSLFLYNTLTRKKEKFVPVKPGRVHIYVCGPTVYSHAHVGHAKSYISFDVIVRYFRYLGYQVKYVQNITDVGHLTDDADEGEDKILKKAREQQLDPVEIAEGFAWSYFEDMQNLGVIRANIFPRATGHITEQIELIQRLIEKDFAYEKNGNVYFDVSKFSDYGKLSGRKVEELEAGARIEVNPDKRHPSDFALWKKAEKGHLMRWPSPWGEGYPGWHIECSAMSMKYLGETIDIHGGGLDNIFPHHECEIAQSEAVTGKPFVNYWLHNNMVTAKGSKMSKSLENFITIKDALAKYTASTLRFFILSSHYRSPLDFSDEALQAAETGVQKLISAIKQVRKKLEISAPIKSFSAPFDTEKFQQAFEKEMNDDFNTPRAIAVLFDFTRETNQYLNSNQEWDLPFLEAINQLYEKVAGDVLGLIPENLMTKDDPGDIDKIINIVVDIRQTLRKEKQFQLADDIRNGLKKAGVILIDQPDGTTFEFESD